jgi:[ribosomal protein S5]-alanine N-acetyltransferase
MTFAPTKLTASDNGMDLSTPNAIPDIVSERLDLIAITPAMLRADFAKSPTFSQLINAHVPAEWPSDGWDENAYNYLLEKMEKYPNSRDWSRYIAVKAEPGKHRVLAGGCGLLGPIELTDDPEIGYGLLGEFQHRGYASEAVAALVEWIFSHPHIRSVNAQTFPNHQPSLRVLARSGFQSAGPGPEEGTILFRKWRK